MSISTDSSLLAIENLKKYYSGKLVLDIPKFAFNENRVHIIIGPNGAGKSTLLNILALLDKATTGKIYYRGKVINPNHTTLKILRRRITLVMQEPYIFKTTVFNNIAYGLKFRMQDKNSVSKSVNRALAAIGLAGFEKRNGRELSEGEKRLVAIARAIVLSPEVLLLDEPTAHLDNQGIERVETLIRELKTTIIMTTQNFEIWNRLSINPTRLDHGRIQNS